MTIENKNNKKTKIKFKSKNNSMFDIKNNINGGIINKNSNKIYAIQAYTGKKPLAGIQLYKNNDKAFKMKKNSEIDIHNSNDIDNTNGVTIEYFLKFMGLELPFNKNDLEQYINDRRSMTVKELINLQQELRKNDVVEFKKKEMEIEEKKKKRKKK